MNIAQRMLEGFLGLRAWAYPPRANSFARPFHPVINRHTGQPHEHKREIARRQRQAARR